jgi:hypothetical protein
VSTGKATWRELDRVRLRFEVALGVTLASMMAFSISIVRGLRREGDWIDWVPVFTLALGIGMAAKYLVALGRFRCLNCGERFAVRASGFIPNPNADECLHCRVRGREE